MGIGDMLQAKADAEDAARYRWLRLHTNQQGWFGAIGNQWLQPFQYDARVDELMRTTRTSAAEPK
jgi:hypothetical protein